MASQPQTTNLPLFFKELVPLNSNDHAKWKVRGLDNAEFLKDVHAIPLTVEEFPQAQRNYPIIFTVGDNPVPLALMGLNEGVNVYMNDDGKMKNPVYVPAYIRRYPFLLAKLRPDSQELSLCFDPSSGAVGDFKDGDDLFDKDGKVTETTQNILKFCEQFEEAGARTGAFMTELKKLDLLMDGEVSITQSGNDKPFLYRGFQMVNEEKLRDLRGDELRKLAQNGMLPLIHAHLFSLQVMREVFAQQVAEGKVPQVTNAPTVDNAAAPAPASAPSKEKAKPAAKKSPAKKASGKDAQIS
ncbi:SapC family protein [Alterisphingorhabdus coralli]|uniref:SapC family protein n=1 Tax=Alterisphingorhabdus coralli TaxID=3071408 RepID=A0AA97I156_9SPHN|nr:SapC family protein [Parasphingorhabdus sp. SCSIO 66989]WOE76384.1 SapC family protein [Parasphingorhabdus sp. SCSIO 66989]